MSTPTKHAVLYRMVTDEHICPFGLKSKDLLERRGFDVDDQHLETREETDEFKREHDVETTPQTFIDGRRVGGYDDLREFFGLGASDADDTTYTPVLAVFGVAALLAVAVSWGSLQTSTSVPAMVRIVELFVAFSMCALALQKLRDLESFSNQFITYDLLGMRVVRYAYVYPFVELLAGVGMIADVVPLVVAPAAFLIGAEGAVSIIKAVYIDRRELKCACVGGDSKVPLGVISLAENLGMVAMAVWMTLHATVFA